MKIAIVGGELQGVEIAYLAHRAGYETLLFDKCRDVPARGICANFMEFHFTKENPWPHLAHCNGKIDLIFPALEDLGTLQLLDTWAKRLNIPLVADLVSFQKSRSKTASNALFEKLQFPLPKTYPECSFPVIIKPDEESGSKDVYIARNSLEFGSFRHKFSADMLVQEYLEGPSFSLEIIGVPGQYMTAQTTELFMDKGFDCCGVSAPTTLDHRVDKKLHEMIVAIAEELSLAGIMDLEVILHENTLKILEIDARFPSQTPITVYLSTGMNMVKMLVELFMANQSRSPLSDAPVRQAKIEHVRVQPGSVEICGEHIMADNGRLHHRTHFFGADEALTTFAPDKKTWVATLMFTGKDKGELDKKHSLCHKLLYLEAGVEHNV